MQGDADIAAVAALIGDRTRSRVLLALGDGRALAASVLAAEAGVSASTISEHLAKLLDAGLLSVESHGRHRYYRLAGPHVARLLESLAQHAPPAPVTSLRQGTRASAVRAGRYCYDHLGGRLGVGMMRALLDRGVLAGGDGRHDPARAVNDRLSAPGGDVDYRLTDAGEDWARAFGIDLEALRAAPAAHPLLHRLERAAAPSRRRAGRGDRRAARGPRVDRARAPRPRDPGHRRGARGAAAAPRRHHPGTLAIYAPY